MSRFHLTPSSKFSVVSGALGVIVFAFSGSLAYAGQECYDFSDLPIGSQYIKGATVDAKHSKATLKQSFVSENQPSQQASQVAEVVSSNIPGGGAPP